MTLSPKRLAIFAVVIAALTAACHIPALGCTSAIVSARMSASGRPLLWKNRDTGQQHNFVERVVTGRHGEFKYIALFNAGDSLLTEAWMGMNEAGFAIMNTASYNLAPDTARIKDREGLVMSRALQVCRTVDDFARLLDTLPKPLGVQANFGVIDADGAGAYFETDDYTYTPFYLSDSKSGVLIRTNFSLTGNDTDGMGYIRYDNANYLLADKISNGAFVAEDFTETCSRSYHHSLIGRDILADTTQHWAVDQDFIPRHSTSASVVIEGALPSGNPTDCVMWTMLGYPGTAHVIPVTFDNIPDAVRPTLPGWRSEASETSLSLRDSHVFSIQRGSGPRYINLDYLRAQIQVQRAISRSNYAEGRNKLH